MAWKPQEGEILNPLPPKPWSIPKRNWGFLWPPLTFTDCGAFHPKGVFKKAIQMWILYHIPHQMCVWQARWGASLQVGGRNSSGIIAVLQTTKISPPWRKLLLWRANSMVYHRFYVKSLPKFPQHLSQISKNLPGQSWHPLPKRKPAASFGGGGRIPQGKARIGNRTNKQIWSCL